MTEYEFYERQIDRKIQEFNQETSNECKLHIVNDIIETKHACGITGLDGDGFRWIRQFISLSILCESETDSNHLVLDTGQIIERIKRRSIPEQISLLRFTTRQLIRNGFEEEAKDFDKKLRALELQDILSRFKLGLSFQLIFQFFTYNWLTVLLGLAITFCIYTMVLIPIENNFFDFFQIKYVNYSKNEFWNHVANMAMSFLDIDSELKIIPKNICGVATIGVVKVIVLAFLYNFFINQLNKNIEK